MRDTPGGGGFGDARQRDPALVVLDVNEGYVTPQAATRDFAVALTRAGRKFALDVAGTQKLRA